MGEFGLPYVVAIRYNHGVWMLREQRVRTTVWRRWDRVFTDGTTETRYLREVIAPRQQRRVFAFDYAQP